MKSASVALLLVLSLCAGARAATFYVDDDAPGDPMPRNPMYSDPDEDGSAQHPFDEIQEAIDAAVDGDTIIVAPGHYLSQDTWTYAELQFKGKSLRLVSSAPTDFSVVEQTVLCGVIIFHGTEDPNCLLQGFKIQNYNSGGILGNKTLASVSHCIISGNGPCGATVLKDVEGEVRNCLIVDNTTFHDCGVLPVVSGCPTLINCTIANNLSGAELPGVGTPGIRDGTVHNCIIYGNQSHQTPPLAAVLSIDYCLLEDRSSATQPPTMGEESTVWSADPCFVRWGHWEDVPTTPAGRTRAIVRAAAADTTKVLVEGDYHLQSQGWRWSEEPTHGSHWYFDTATSLAIDAGDPMDSLGEELERAPDDPEGRWGFNHAIELGAYGGTAQASLTPTQGEPPGVGAVDLQDYWPINLSNQWIVHDPQGTAREIYASGGGGATGSGGTYYYYYHLRTSNAPNWVTRLSCYYLDRTFYLALDTYVHPFQPPEQIQARYPQYLVVGAAIQVPYDPFVNTTVQYQSAVVVRGTLAEVLAGTSVDPNQLLAGAWPDVIAFQDTGTDGTPGDPIAIFARGFGPLVLAGQPIEGARVGDKTFGTYETPIGGRVR
jgi:hypothetical protein